MIRAYDIVGHVGLSMTFCGLASLPIGAIMLGHRIYNMGLSVIVAGLAVMCLALIIECPPLDWNVSRRWKIILPVQYVGALGATLLVAYPLFIEHKHPSQHLWAILLVSFLSATFNTVVAATDQDELTKREVEAMIAKIEKQRQAE